MGSRGFDRITQTLGETTSRRQALKLIGGWAASGLLVSLGVGCGPQGNFSQAPTDSYEPELTPLATPTCGGYPYDPQTQCCTSGFVETKYPMDDSFLCPNRVQHPGYVMEANGCGPIGKDLLVPDKYGRATFTDACNIHDVCWQTCNKTQSDCDYEFYNNLVLACATAYPKATKKYEMCRERASYYYTAVQDATDHWRATQQKSCDCCETQCSNCSECEDCIDGACVQRPNCGGVMCHDGACPENYYCYKVYIDEFGYHPVCCTNTPTFHCTCPSGYANCPGTGMCYKGGC